MSTAIELPAGRQPSSNQSRGSADDPAWIREINGYVVIAKVGQGGMGAVYKARQMSLDRIVALKVLPPEIAASASFIERFQREARVSAKLCHPNLVQGIDIGQDPKSKLWYFAMEFVDGPTLKTVLKQERRIPEKRALEIAREVAKALNAIHGVGLIHRDIKPDNILLNAAGEVKVADFGLTREVNDDAEMTQAGKTVGTPKYMPPEQVRGESALDIRSDLYALGATLFHLVTGEPPFTGASAAEIMSKHLTETPPLAYKLNRDVSELCSQLIAKLLAKKRDDRVQTPQELIARINALLGHDEDKSEKRTPVGAAAGRSAPARHITPPAAHRAVVAHVSRASQSSQEGPGPMHSHAPRKVARSGSSNALALWGAVAAAVVLACIGLFTTLAKPEPSAARAHVEKEIPVPEPAAVEVSVAAQSAHAKPIADAHPRPAVESRDEKARAALNAALEIENARPDSYAEILASFERAAPVVSGTAVAPQLASARKVTESRWAGDFSRALKVQTNIAKGASLRHDFTNAWAALSDTSIPGGLQVLNWREQLDAARNSVREGAENEAVQLLSDARLLADAGTEAGLSGALEKLNAVDEIPAPLAPSTGKSAEARSHYIAQLATLRHKAESAKQELSPKARELVAAARKELAPLLAQSHFTAALEQLEKKLRDPAIVSVKDALAADKADLEAIIALRQRAVDAIRASAGNAITLNRGKSVIAGKVVSNSNSKAISVKLAEGPQMTFGPDQLEARDINQYAPAEQGAAKAEDLRRRGLLFLATDDLAKAKEFFAAAQGAGPGAGSGDAVKPYLERIESVELGELEVRARQDWTEAEALFQSKRWDDAIRAYTHFKDTQAKTHFFESVAELLPRRLEEAAIGLHPVREGLLATIYRKNGLNETDKVLVRVDKVLDFDWTIAPPIPEVPHGDYSIRWNGFVKAPKAGHYTFITEIDDGSRLWIDGKQLTDDWNNHAPKRVTGEIDLTEGLHELRLEYFQEGGGAACHLRWALKGAFNETLIPADALYHEVKQEPKKLGVINRE